MYDLVFFRKAAMVICSGLDPAKMIENCFFFLKKYMPLDAISMAVQDNDKTFRTINYFTTDLLFSKGIEGKPHTFSPESLKYIDDLSAKQCHFVKDPRNVPPPVRELSKFFDIEELSSFVLNLELIRHISNIRMGVVWIAARGLHRFTEEHVKLIEMLHDPFAVALSNILQYQELVRLQNLLKDDYRFLHNELYGTSEQKIIGEDDGLNEIMKMIRMVAPLNNTVLLLGETGVGKELIANALHFFSERSKGPFIKVNCGAIPDNLIDSELFGHVKGAFTGAVSDQRGRFERAHRGTILLDEIGELPLSAQVRLLRVLQFRELERVGSSEIKKIDVRIIASTNRDIKAMVRSGTFREDLWFRINVLPITIPPLRQRRESIPALVEHFIESNAKKFQLKCLPKVSPEALQRLKAYDWPGNVRELENAVEREVLRNMVGNQTSFLEFEEFSMYDPAKSYPENKGNAAKNQTFDDHAREHIIRVLDMTRGKISGGKGAAAILNINPSTLRHRMIKLGIPFDQKK